MAEIKVDKQVTPAVETKPAAPSISLKKLTPNTDLLSGIKTTESGAAPQRLPQMREGQDLFTATLPPVRKIEESLRALVEREVPTVSAAKQDLKRNLG